MQARTIAIIGRFLCRVCLFGLGFTSVEWSIDEQGQLPEGVEPGASPHKPVGRLVACPLSCGTGRPACRNKADGALYIVPAAAIVSNHISYMDIIVHLGHSFPSFVARGNTQDMPLIGLIRWALMP